MVYHDALAIRAHLYLSFSLCRRPSCWRSWLCSVDYSIIPKSAQNRQQIVTFGCTVSATNHLILLALKIFSTVRISWSITLKAIYPVVARFSYLAAQFCHVHKLNRDRIPVTRYWYWHQGLSSTAALHHIVYCLELIRNWEINVTLNTVTALIQNSIRFCLPNTHWAAPTETHKRHRKAQSIEDVSTR